MKKVHQNRWCVKRKNQENEELNTFNFDIMVISLIVSFRLKDISGSKTITVFKPVVFCQVSDCVFKPILLSSHYEILRSFEFQHL